MFRVMIVVLTVVALVLAGCGQIAQKAVEKATGVETDKKGDTITIKGKEGEQLTIGGTTLPNELKDFPVPQGFKLDSTASMSTGGEKLTVATWKGKSPMATVVSFFKKGMVDQGYKEEYVLEADSGSQLSYSKGEMSATITLSKSGEDTEISLLYGKSSQK